MFQESNRLCFNTGRANGIQSKQACTHTFKGCVHMTFHTTQLAQPGPRRGARPFRCSRNSWYRAILGQRSLLGPWFKSSLGQGQTGNVDV